MLAWSSLLQLGRSHTLITWHVALGRVSNHAAHEWAAHGLSDICHDVKSALGVGVQILTDPSVLVSLPKGSDGRPADVGLFGRYGHRRACVAAGGRRTRDEGVIWKGDPGDFYMKVIAKKFRGVWHYGVITGVVTEWVLEDYGGATQWRAVFEDGSGKVTVQSGWVMEDCLHHMETFSILNAGPLLEEARVKAIMTEKELRVPRRWTRSLGRGGLDTPRGAKARRPGQRGAKARRPGQRGAKARRPGQRGAKARRPGQRGAKARRPGQRGAKTAHTAESAERDALQAVDGSR
eukprot:jgi/Tetstr1/423277/TSEL_013976.t1